MRYLAAPVYKRIAQNKVENHNNENSNFKPNYEIDRYVTSVYSSIYAYRRKVDYRGIVIDKKF